MGILAGVVIPFFSFRVQLLGVEPPIWRTFLLREAASFQELHVAIQKACGWGDRHLFSFRETAKGPVIAGIPHYQSKESIPDATRTKVRSYYSKPGQSCVYQYDFGDCWEHELTLVEMASRSDHDRFIRKLTGGARAFPPEDCGGTWGYEMCVAIRNGNAVELSPAEIKAREKWLGDWQPEHFKYDVARAAFDV